MDKTFAETKGQPPFDWNLALANPPERYSEEYFDLLFLSQSWVTCACGNQCAIIPRGNYTNAPLDTLLVNLGVKFCGNVGDCDWPQAKLTLAHIKARSTILITEELAKLNAKGAE